MSDATQDMVARLQERLQLVADLHAIDLFGRDRTPHICFFPHSQHTNKQTLHIPCGVHSFFVDKGVLLVNQHRQG